MSSQEITNKQDVAAALKEVDRIVSLDEITDAQVEFLIEVLQKYTNERIYISGRLVKIISRLERNLIELLSASDDFDLAVHCALMLMTNGRDIGAAYLLRALAIGHPLEIVIARNLAQRGIEGVSQALCFSLNDRPHLFFPKFIELTYILFSLDRESANRILKNYMYFNKDVEVKFYQDKIEKILAA